MSAGHDNGKHRAKLECELQSLEAAFAGELVHFAKI